MRTAAGAILSVKHLARKDGKSLAIIGAGVLGHAHLKMIGTLVGIEEIWIASKDFSQAQTLAALDSRARAVDSVQDAVSHPDIVCLCTSSAEPVFQAEWLKEGVHISSVGYRPPGGELPRDLVESSHIFVESNVAFSAPPVGCSELQGLDPESGRSWEKCYCNGDQAEGPKKRRRFINHGTRHGRPRRRESGLSKSNHPKNRKRAPRR